MPEEPAEEILNRITAVAAEICPAPTAFICFVEETGLRLKAALGLRPAETSSVQFFCGQAIEKSGLFILKDTAADDRFSQKGQPRFFAAAPLGPHSTFTLTLPVNRKNTP